MGMVASALAVTVLVAAALTGCGSESSSTGGAIGHPHGGFARNAESQRDHGVGMSAPISRVIVARRARPWPGRPRGTESIGSKGCVQEEGRAEISIYTDVAEPLCVRVTGGEPVLIVNRTNAYRRSDGKPIVVRLGPYRARLLPQQAARFGPVGRFLGRGFHQALVGAGARLGVLILPRDCAILRPEPGEALCFAKDRPGRLRRWRRTQARLRAPACRGSGLAISAARHSSIGSGGTIYTRLTIINLSPRPCTVAGVPRVIAIGRHGRPVGRAEAVPHLRPGSEGGRRRVRLRGQGSATFEVSHYDGIGAGRCRFALAYGLRVTVPGAGPTQVVPIRMSYCPAPGAGIGLKVGRIE